MNKQLMESANEEFEKALKYDGMIAKSELGSMKAKLAKRTCDKHLDEAARLENEAFTS